jgi:transcriptional regulator with XRE-family HTH domain
VTAPGPEPLRGWRLRDYDALIATLRQAWLTRGPTQDALARRMHCSRTVVADWLAGRAGHGPRRLFDLAAALGYDLALVPRQAETVESATELLSPEDAAFVLGPLLEARIRDASVRLVDEDAPRGPLSATLAAQNAPASEIPHGRAGERHRRRHRPPHRRRPRHHLVLPSRTVRAGISRRAPPHRRTRRRHVRHRSARGARLVTTYEEWRATGTLRSGKPYDSEYDRKEQAARALVAMARARGTFTDGPHLHKRTVTVTDWEAIQP